MINNHKVCFQLLHDRSDRSKMVQGTQVHLQTQADEVHEGYEAAGHVEIKTVLGKPCEICEAWDFSGIFCCWFWIVWKASMGRYDAFLGTKIKSYIYREPHDGIPIPILITRIHLPEETSHEKIIGMGRNGIRSFGQKSGLSNERSCSMLFHPIDQPIESYSFNSCIESEL